MGQKNKTSWVVELQQHPDGIWETTVCFESKLPAVFPGRTAFAAVTAANAFVQKSLKELTEARAA